ncbi:MAG: hypothetical protein ABIG95_03890 [Candidatus Woesearchaeota archaeon]
MNKLAFVLVGVLLLPSLALAYTQQYNYSIEVYNATDLAKPYLLEFHKNVTFFAANESAAVACTAWVHDCISPVFIDGSLKQTVWLRVPGNLAAGIYYHNITLTPVGNVSVQPEMVLFQFNVSHYINFTFVPTNITNTTNTTNTTTPKELHNLTTQAKQTFTYNQMQLPHDFLIEITVGGTPGLNLTVRYDPWLSGPSVINMTENAYTFNANMSIPSVALGTYKRKVYFKDPVTNKSLELLYRVDIKETEWERTDVDVEDLPPDVLADYWIEYWKDYQSDYLNRLAENDSLVVTQEKDRLLPVNYDFMSDIYTYCNPEVIAQLKSSNVQCNLNQNITSDSWGSCELDKQVLDSKNIDMRDRNLRLEEQNTNHTLKKQALQRELDGYDRNHVGNTAFFIVLSLLVVFVGWKLFVFVFGWYAEYMD